MRGDNIWIPVGMTMHAITAGIAGALGLTTLSGMQQAKSAGFYVIASFIFVFISLRTSKALWGMALQALLAAILATLGIIIVTLGYMFTATGLSLLIVAAVWAIRRRKRGMFELKILLRWLFGWWLNLYGRSVGSSHCSYCKCTWNWVNNFTIPYAIGGGMSPLCKLCFTNLDAEEVIAHAEELADSWNLKSEKERKKIKVDVAAAILYIKRKTDTPPFERYGGWNRFNSVS